MTDVEGFVAAIRDTIETQLMEQGQGEQFDAPLVFENAAGLRIDGYLDLDALARAVHRTVITYQAPPF